LEFGVNKIPKTPEGLNGDEQKIIFWILSRRGGGIWNLEFGIWDLGLGIWDLKIRIAQFY